MKKKDIVIKSIKPIIAKLKKSKDIIAKERDKLRDYKEEIESLDESCENSLIALEESIDYLSQYLLGIRYDI